MEGPAAGGLFDYADSAKWCSYSITPCSPLGRATNLKASPLLPAPLTIGGFLAAGLLALQYSDRIDGLLGLSNLALGLVDFSAGMRACSLVSGC